MRYNFAVRLRGSLWRKALVTVVAAATLVWLYEVTILDSRHVGDEATAEDAAAPRAGSRLAFTSTAYCKGLLTASGVPPQSGIAAADPSLLPVGSVVQLESSDPDHNGIYTVLDTGPAVHGREVDIYIWNCNEALTFGRRPAMVTVLRLGWNPQAIPSTLLQRFFRRPAPDQAPRPSRPLPLTTSGS